MIFNFDVRIAESLTIWGRLNHFCRKNSLSHAGFTRILGDVARSSIDRVSASKPKVVVRPRHAHHSTFAIYGQMDSRQNREN